jgi:DNA-directed RNA polymerase specialized sigma24 family protein
MLQPTPSLLEALRDSAHYVPWNRAWDRFVALCEAPLLGHLSGKFPVLSRTELLDVFQETMVKMRRSGIREADPAKGGIASLLYTIAGRCAIDALRKREVRSRHAVSLDASRSMDDTELHESVSTPAAASADDAWEEKRALVDDALAVLLRSGAFAAKTLSIFRELMHGDTPQTLADRHQTSVGNVYQSKSAVLQRLAAVMALVDGQGLTVEQAVARSSPSTRHDSTMP